MEFGQGVVQTVACDDEVTLTPYSSFVNESGAGSFKFTSISVTGIDEECDGRVFTIKAYKNGEDEPLPLYVTGGSTTYDQLKVADTAGTFSLVEAGLDSNDIEQLPDESGFIVYLYTYDPPGSVAASDANDVDRITIESNVGSGASPSPSPSPTPSTIYSFWTSQNEWAGMSARYWGQTFTIPLGASGGIISISGIKLQLGCLSDDDSVVSAIVRIYDNPTKTILLGTASETLQVVDDCALGSFGTIGTFTATFPAPIEVVEGQQYFFELERTTHPWWGNFYFLGDSNGYAYEGGSGYVNGVSQFFDLSFRVNFDT